MQSIEVDIRCPQRIEAALPPQYVEIDPAKQSSACADCEVCDELVCVYLKDQYLAEHPLEGATVEGTCGITGEDFVIDL